MSLKKGLSKRRIRIRESSVMRDRRRMKRKRKTRNIQKNALGGKFEKSGASRKRKYANTTIKRVPPKDFTINNIENVIEFINSTYNKGKLDQVKQINFDLHKIIHIDMYAICLLLALMNKLAGIQTFSKGNFPKDKDAKAFLISSGFLNVLHTNVIMTSSNKVFNNQIYTIGKNSLLCEKISKSIKMMMKQLTGLEQYYPPLYRIMVEICANSVEHANEEDNDKNWLVSISSEEDIMHFILTDIGKGILKTLHKKKSEMFIDKLKGNDKILISVFEGGYQSLTKEVNRHKGLPSILEAYNDGYISNLIVLTNNVLCDFNKNKSQILKKYFKGTLYSWTINIKNFEKWKSLICM